MQKLVVFPTHEADENVLFLSYGMVISTLGADKTVCSDVLSSAALYHVYIC